jgi:hypothetical protein
VEKIKLYGREKGLIGEIPITDELCKELLSLEKRERLLEVANLVTLLLTKEGVNLTPEQVLFELEKVVVCGEEIKLEGGNPA